jgi:lipoprotein-anchoring transpeptidase ErfK/SrfK
VRLLIVLAVAIAVEVWWRSSRTPSGPRPERPSIPATRVEVTPATPVPEKTGKPAPTTVLPVSARLAPVSPIKAPAPPLVTRTNAPLSVVPVRPPFDERILRAQVALARRAISSGPLDGVMGSQTRAALRTFQQSQGLPLTGSVDDATTAKLELAEPLYTNYVATSEDLSSLQPLGKTWLEKSQQSSLAYETALELVAEKSHSNPKLVRWLNPQVDCDRISAGTSLQVVNADYPPPESNAAFVRIFLNERKLQVFDGNSNLLAHFPCSIAARVDKRPLGEELHIAAVAPNPNYTFDPAVFPESAEAQELGRKLILQPGPNNPVGTVWFSLDKPGYGIHGTPRPEDVGRTESHGCFRLANWNAEYLLKLVTVGTPVFVDP